MINENILKNKAINHFYFLKKSENFSELLSKNLKVKNRYSSLLPLTKLIGGLKFKKKIDLNFWLKKKDKIAFYLIKKNFFPEIIIGISINSKLQLKFSILYGKNKISEVTESLVVLIKYFRETIYFHEFKLDNSFNRKITKKIFSNSVFKKKHNILTAGPSISLLEISNTNKAVRYGWNDKSSNYINEFEYYFAKYLNIKHALSTSSCTGALQIALMALDIGMNDEVIVPDLTWVATANAVRAVGANPVFADVELDTWNIDANSILKKITKKTKAIIVVHLYGHPARMDKIIKIAKRYKLKIIEDAAPAIGAEWQGKKCGTFGSFAAFSFQGAKLLVTGEGGMLVTNNTNLYKKAYKIWNQGRNENKQFWIDTKGVKFNMSNMQAAFGLAQITRVEEQIEMKRRIFDWYYGNLNHFDYFDLNKEVIDAKSIYWMTSLFIKNNNIVDRNKLMRLLKNFNIDTRPVFSAISTYPIWLKKFLPQKNSLLISQNSINLPSGISLTKKDVDYICNIIEGIFTKRIN